MRPRFAALALIAGISLLNPRVGGAVTGAFSDASSDTTPAEWLAARLSYSLVDQRTLDVAITNETSEDAPFDIMFVFFNRGPSLSYVDLVRAESSVDGENTHAWRLGYYDYDRKTAGFGDFDYSLRTEPGAPDDHRIAPGETQRFVLSVDCASYAGCDESVIDGWSEGGRRSAFAALRFAYGPRGDAAFGALLTAVPEPHSAALVALGLLALSGARRRRAATR